MNFSSSRSSSRRQDGSYTTIPDEYDRGERNACFYLYTRPLDDAILKESDNIALHHWALIAVFVDESVRTMEGNESGGLLMPYYMKETPREANNQKGKYYELIPIKTSPDKLHYVTRNNPLNCTPYSATSNNCQCWVKKAAEMISSKLADSLKNYKSNKEIGPIATAAKCSWASSKASSKSVSRSLVRSAQLACSGSPIEHHRLD